MEALLNYFQDCSTFQSEDSGYGMRLLSKKHQAWLLNSWQIEIYRLPAHGERVKIGTIPYDLRGCFGYRNFFMDTEEGERLAAANSLWTLIDMKETKPVRVGEEQKKAYPLGERIQMEYLPRKIRLPEEVADQKGTAGAPIVVRESHLDTNGHVNNEQYVHMALALFGEESRRMQRLRVEYKEQAHLGDVIHPVLYEWRQEGAQTTTDTVFLNAEDGSCYCICEMVYGEKNA